MKPDAKSLSPEAASGGATDPVSDTPTQDRVPGRPIPHDVTGSEPAESSAIEQTLQAFRSGIVAEIYAMSRHLTGGNRTDSVSPNAAAILGALDRGERPVMEDLLIAHSDLKGLVAPAAPHALLTSDEQIQSPGFLRFLGPNAVVRHLTLANVFFLVLFFGVSMSPEITLSTLNLSLYEQTGYPLFIRLVFLVAAAGLGASFGALFDVWDGIRTYTFDPSGGSLHWMKICLGIVAGLALTEIFQASAITADGERSTSDALMALVGGFSANLLYIALSRTTNAVKNIFAPAGQS